jgi:hypothetical protein
VSEVCGRKRLKTRHWVKESKRRAGENQTMEILLLSWAWTGQARDTEIIPVGCAGRCNDAS